MERALAGGGQTAVFRRGDVVIRETGGVLIAPGGTYLSMAGALDAIRYARENDLPLPGTCAGFQHVLVEYARNVTGIAGADHAEVNPDADELVCVPLTLYVPQAAPAQHDPHPVLAGFLKAAAG